MKLRSYLFSLISFKTLNNVSNSLFFPKICPANSKAQPLGAATCCRQVFQTFAEGCRRRSSDVCPGHSLVRNRLLQTPLRLHSVCLLNRLLCLCEPCRPLQWAHGAEQSCRISPCTALWSLQKKGGSWVTFHSLTTRAHLQCFLLLYFLCL